MSANVEMQNVGDGEEMPARALQTEEEILLYFRVLQAHGTREALISRLQSRAFGALTQLSEGRKTAFLMALPILEAAQEWDTLHAFCTTALSRGPGGSAVNLLAADWAVWKALILSARMCDGQKE